MHFYFFRRLMDFFPLSNQNYFPPSNEDNIKFKESTKMSSKTNGSSDKGMSDSSKTKLAKDNIKNLRNKILMGSTTNRNPLINYKHSDRKRGQVRIVDELPNEIYKDLIADKSFIFRPLPEPTYQPKDENTPEFKTEFAKAQKEDEIFLNKIKKMGDKYDGSSKESLEVERELKDRIRIKLKMNKREGRIRQIPKPIIYDVGLMVE